MGRMGSGRRTYSASPADYKLLEEVGYGASATVYRAIYLPLNEVVAIKCLDLDRCNSNLDDVRKEAQTMSLIEHPNVVTAYCSFSVEKCLWVVMPFMAEGSCLHLMKIAYPDGFEEVVIGSILKETLKALEYLHRHGHIHRDVKAGNILLDSNGVVKLGDFGVSACLFDKGDRQRSRNTFVGTPCWMAPEVLQPGSGYDFKADIWSFGITALELAHGHAPFSKYPPMKVLLMTIQNAPPGLDYDRDKKFSKAFKEMVAMCLVKDQTKRPTAEKLLKHSFFKHAKSPELSLKSILHDLPPLWDRVKALQLKDAAQLALKKMPSAEQEALSQSEYKRGVSAWNFDIEDLKAQASLVQDDDDMKEEDESTRMFADEKEPDASISGLGNSMSSNYLNSRTTNNTECVEVKCSTSNCEIEEIDVTDYAYQKSFDRHDKEVTSNMAVSSTSKKDTGSDPSKPQLGKGRLIHSGPLLPSNVVSQSLGDQDRSSVRSDADIQPSTDKYKREARKAPNFSGPLMLPNRASANSLSAPIRSSGGYRDSFEEKSKPNVIQVKGRFSITSGQVELAKDNSISSASRRSSQGSPLRKSASVGDWVFDSRQAVYSEPIKLKTGCFSQSIGQSPKETINASVPASVLMPHLQNLFQQTAFQQDLIVSLLNSVQQVEAGDGEAVQSGKMQSDARNPDNHTAVELVSSERERLLLVKIQELQARMTNLTEELTAAKLKHVQLQQQLNAAYGREEEGSILEDNES